MYPGSRPVPSYLEGHQWLSVMVGYVLTERLLETRDQHQAGYEPVNTIRFDVRIKVVFLR